MTHKLSVFLLLLLTLSLSAQKRKVPILTAEQQARQAKLLRMMENTQRITFIDSIVIGKKQFLQAYSLSKEVGQIGRYQDFFHDTQQPEGFIHVNELCSHCYLSLAPNDTMLQLYLCDNINNKWSRPKALKELNDMKQFRRMNYPFMMGDGETLYFAAEDNEGLGGYDIYVTRYNSEENTFLHPVNIGMPFNSEGNDYLYVIDEYCNLGWFATDRRQSPDSVCVYTFIPPTVRQTYQAEGLNPEKLVSLARLERIEDTREDSLAYHDAMKRLQDIREQQNDQSANRSFTFVINDNITYFQLSDFRVTGNSRRFTELRTLLRQYERLSTALENARNSYASADAAGQAELRPEILAAEQKKHELHGKIKQLEKIIRNTEITSHTK